MVVNGYEIKPYADLSGADLKERDLCEQVLAFAILTRATLRRTLLVNTNLTHAILLGADLSYANLWRADLSNTDLRYSDLSCANLTQADLTGANLTGANLVGANFDKAILKDTKIKWPMHCPSEGSFIGWKKASGNYLVKLLIPEDAKRLSATTNKCRCDKAKVLDIVNIYKREAPTYKVSSHYDENFIYEIGKMVSVDNFDENRWNECSTGIHFFLSKEEAIDYLLL